MNQQQSISTYEALVWQMEIGADACVEAEPQVSRASTVVRREQVRPFQASTSEISSEPSGKHLLTAQYSRHTTPTPPASLSAAVAEARTLADGANDLAALEAALRGFEGCALKKTAMNTVFANGVAGSPTLFIGETPGADDDRSGLAFSGEMGQLMDRMLAAIALKRDENCFLSHAVFWRPPGNRLATAEEIEICKPFLEKLIALANPRVLVLMGGTATSAVLGEAQGITRLRGKQFSYRNRYLDHEIPAIAMFHPNYLMKQPLAKKQAWADLLTIKAKLSA